MSDSITVPKPERAEHNGAIAVKGGDFHDVEFWNGIDYFDDVDGQMSPEQLTAYQVTSDGNNIYRTNSLVVGITMFKTGGGQDDYTF